jgi:hypothetical protein
MHDSRPRTRLRMPAGAFLRYDSQRGAIELVARDGAALPAHDQQRFFEQLPIVTLETFKAMMRIAQQQC